MRALYKGRKSLLIVLLLLIWIQTLFLVVNYAPQSWQDFVRRGFELENEILLTFRDGSTRGYRISVKTKNPEPLFEDLRNLSNLWYSKSSANFTEFCQEVRLRNKADWVSRRLREWNETDEVFRLADDTSTYFVQLGDTTCLKHGTNLTSLRLLEASSNASQKLACPCVAGWHGQHCSIPSSVFHSNLPKRFVPTLRPKPRRIVQAFPFNYEFEMLEARFNEIGRFVDVFMILESNYSAYGTPKALHLLDRLKQGEYGHMAHKILHVFLGYFPPKAHSNGWIEDDLLRDHIATHGVVHQLKGYKHDDIFFMTDADELPRWENLLFLKLHDGYPIPIGIYLQKNTYGFFWSGKQTHVMAVVTMGFLMHVFEKHAIWIRSAPAHVQKQASAVSIYLKTGGLVYPWSFGTKVEPAGWHCSWCCLPDCIRNKLVSAQNGDFPRWGDYPEKTRIPYIRKLIANGTWFDNKSTMLKSSPRNPMYAPPHIICNPERYQHILTNIYASEDANIQCPKEKT